MLFEHRFIVFDTLVGLNFTRHHVVLLIFTLILVLWYGVYRSWLKEYENAYIFDVNILLSLLTFLTLHFKLVFIFAFIVFIFVYF